MAESHENRCIQKDNNSTSDQSGDWDMTLQWNKMGENPKLRWDCCTNAVEQLLLQQANHNAACNPQTG